MDATKVGRNSPARGRFWPMAIPYPEAELAVAPIVASRRRQQRWQQTKLFRQIVNGMVSAYSLIALGGPSVGPACACARCRLSGPQVEMVELMEKVAVCMPHCGA